MRCSLLPAAFALALLALAAPGRAQTLTVVAPNDFTTADGDTANFLPFFPGTDGGTPPAFVPVRYQQVFAAAQFALLPAGGAFISQLAFRVDAPTSNAPFALAIGNIRLDLSTARHGPDALSNTFANNVGADNVTVFPAGPLTLASTNTDAGNGTRTFDVTIALTTPFFYNPDNGPLLLDVRNASGAGVQGDPRTQPSFDATEVGASSGEVNGGTSRLYHLGDVTTATVDPDHNFNDGADSLGLVTRFTVVPEPSVWLLLAAGAAGLAGRICLRPGDAAQRPGPGRGIEAGR